jgi:nucleoside-diphosphate-sugar epimerase
LENDSKSNPYGYLKRQDEIEFDQYCRENSINISIGRLWGASGKDFINPNKYAFGEFILKSLANEDISIESPRAVFRKYCDSEQFMQICIRTAQTWPQTIFNSSGELLEIEDLAKLVTKTLNSKIKVRRKYFDANIVPDDYYSRDEDFIKLAETLGIKLLSTREQILKTFDFLKTSVNRLT